MSDVTRILKSIENGEPQAADELLPSVYDELRKLAGARMAQENPGQTLQATALVHEAYVRLVDVDLQQKWESRGHFFAAAGEAMRRILVERARAKRAEKRGGDRKRLILDIEEPEVGGRSEQLLALDESLDRLEAIDADKARIVKLRYFAGLTVEQAAEAMGVSIATANRWWAYARAWLHNDLQAVS